jgi:hypothetical protein
MTHDIDRLLAAERQAPAPPAAVKARVFDAVRASIAAPPPPTPTIDPATSIGAAAKLTGVLLAGAIAGAGMHAILRPPEREVTVVKIPVPIEIVRQVPIPAPPIEPPITPPPRAKPRPASDLAAERVLLEQARTALAKRNPADAIAALEAHRKKFAQGQLREERLALEVQALVSADRRTDAEARAAELRTEYPRSLFLPVVDAALGP